MTAGSQSPPEATGSRAEKGEDTQVQSSQQPKNDGPPAPPAYTAIPAYRRTFILSIVTVAGFFGPLAGNIYLPALLVLEREFHVSSTVINATVSVFMIVFAFGVRYSPTG
jgi:hypothetical protein